MLTAKTLSPAAINALKEALSKIYWYKKELKSFLLASLENKDLIGRLDWGNYKIVIVSSLIDYMVHNSSQYFDELVKLCVDVCSVKSFSHLENLEDGKKKANEAKEAVAALEEFLKPHKNIIEEQFNIEQRRQKAQEEMSRKKTFKEEIEKIRSKYMTMASSSDYVNRGFELEKIMYELFSICDLDPKASFRNRGEQIDGAFHLEGTDYIFEAKWQKELVTRAELDVFSAKIRRKLENTLGVFLSINGYSSEGVGIHDANGAAMVLLDGMDLMAVLEERIDFVSLVHRKKRHAAHTGEIYLRISDILTS